MIRMSTPAINDRIGEMWATVMCMNYLSVEVRPDRGRIIAGPSSASRDAQERNAGSGLRENCLEIAANAAGVSRNIAELAALATGRATGAAPKITSKELLHAEQDSRPLQRSGVAIGSPIAAQAQSGVTVGRAPVVVDSGPTIAVEQRPAFREYVVEQRVPAFSVSRIA